MTLPFLKYIFFLFANEIGSYDHEEVYSLFMFWKTWRVGHCLYYCFIIFNWFGHCLLSPSFIFENFFMSFLSAYMKPQANLISFILVLLISQLKPVLTSIFYHSHSHFPVLHDLSFSVHLFRHYKNKSIRQHLQCDEFFHCLVHNYLFQIEFQFLELTVKTTLK